MNEKIMDVVASLAELCVLPDKYRQERLSKLPQDGNDCYVYSFLITPVLLDKMANAGMNLPMISHMLHELYSNEEYNAMHMYLIMCFNAMDIDPPPLFLEFSLDDELRAMLMYEILQEVDEYIEPDDFFEEVGFDE